MTSNKQPAHWINIFSISKTGCVCTNVWAQHVQISSIVKKKWEAVARFFIIILFLYVPVVAPPPSTPPHTHTHTFPHPIALPLAHTPPPSQTGIPLPWSLNSVSVSLSLFPLPGIHLMGAWHQGLAQLLMLWCVYRQEKQCFLLFFSFKGWGRMRTWLVTDRRAHCLRAPAEQTLMGSGLWALLVNSCWTATLKCLLHLAALLYLFLSLLRLCPWRIPPA